MPDETTPPEELEATRQLIASVEELRALLAPLSEDERRRVLDLARSLRHPPGGARLSRSPLGGERVRRPSAS